MDDFEDDLFGSDEPEIVEEALEETTTEDEAEEVETSNVEEVANEEEPETETPQVAEEGIKHDAPVAALTAERQKRQDAERELEALRAEKAKWSTKEQQPRATQEQEFTKAPDPFDDPDGFDTYHRQQARKIAAEEAQIQAQQIAFNYRVQDSWDKAVSEHGAEKVETAKAWAMQYQELDPTFEGAFLAQRDPIAWVVQQHQRNRMLKEVESDPKAWALNYIKQHNLLETETAPAADVQKQEAPIKAPKSIASVASATGRKPQAGDTFDSDIFG